jgi:hypothetical protein
MDATVSYPESANAVAKQLATSSSEGDCDQLSFSVHPTTRLPNGLAVTGKLAH